MYVRGGRQRTLLVMLLLNANVTVSKEQLIDEIWGERPPAQVDNALQAVATRLRRSLDSWYGPGCAKERLGTEQSGYRLHLAEDELDLLCFEALCSEARRLGQVDHAAASAKLDEALALWRGPALQGVAGGLLCRSAATRLDEVRLLTLEEKFNLEIQGGRYQMAVAELCRMTILHPLHERFSEQLMIALYRAGRTAEALDAYRRLHTVLRTELGLDPSPVLQARMQAILQHDMPVPNPPMAHLPAAPSSRRSRRRSGSRG
ncbi:AfsR/SARP family transcriptional regulator [Streptomyces ficellus]|uniref:AfsR/SARP family transcriptional regulator n=2 Tax=Streptomyces ficellus TaxID=1977088 RepID=A0ABT7Z4L0_9ACTN|nr:AfsR/SARP family transcriptional regulator [Streptomyces ficellus]MDN3294439.1 AfsR/SARP family transcriptional regulator [Streptomyces ficellus]